MVDTSLCSHCTYKSGEIHFCKKQRFFGIFSSLIRFNICNASLLFARLCLFVNKTNLYSQKSFPSLLWQRRESHSLNIAKYNLVKILYLLAILALEIFMIKARHELSSGAFYQGRSKTDTDFPFFLIHFLFIDTFTSTWKSTHACL